MRNFLKIFVFTFLLISLSSVAVAKLKIVCSNYPTYLFTKEILGQVDAEVLLIGGFALACDHDYALTALDLNNISEADLLIINGLDYEGYLNKAIEAGNKNLKVIEASSGIQALQTEISNGQFHKNPHVFTSPQLAQKMVINISQALAQYDENNKEVFQENAQNFSVILNNLAQEVKQANIGLNIIAGHDVFDYLAQDFNINILGYLEESQNSGFSAAKVIALNKLIKEKQIAAIVLDKNENEALAKVLQKENMVNIVELNFFILGPEHLENYALYYQKITKENIEKLKNLKTNKTRG